MPSASPTACQRHVRGLSMRTWAPISCRCSAEGAPPHGFYRSSPKPRQPSGAKSILGETAGRPLCPPTRTCKQMPRISSRIYMHFKQIFDWTAASFAAPRKRFLAVGRPRGRSRFSFSDVPWMSGNYGGASSVLPRQQRSAQVAADKLVTKRG